MDINYIILAHQHPAQLQRLVSRLAAAETYFYIHIDSRAAIEPFKAQLASLQNVFFLPNREAGTWGDIGIVKATCHALRKILDDNRNGYCILLSGQDYPIKAPAQIRQFLEKHNGTIYADIWPLPYKKWFNGGLYRLQFYKYNVPDSSRPYTLVPPIFSKAFFEHPVGNGRKVWKLIRHGHLPLRLMRKRKMPGSIHPYGGSQWWAITTAVAQKLVSFSEKQKDYLKFHRFTLLADEIFFQSLIAYIAQEEKISIQPALTYVRFLEGEAHPVTFSTEHIDEIRKAGSGKPEKHFVRKFDPDDSVLNMIDQFF